MRIYLARHGESDVALSDDERELNEKGIADIRHLADFMAPLKLQVSYIFQSPKRRAQQTATILASSISVIKGTETKISLQPLSSINDMHSELLALNEDVLIAGHMPFLGQLAAKLLTGNENKDIVTFNAGSLLCLEKVGNDQFVICWMLSPELFK